MCILYSCWESSIFSEGTKSRALLLNAVNEWGAFIDSFMDPFPASYTIVNWFDLHQSTMNNS